MTGDGLTANKGLTIGVVGAAAIAQGNVEHPIRAKGQTAAIVVKLRFVDTQQDLFRGRVDDALGGGGIGHGPLGDNALRIGRGCHRDGGVIRRAADRFGHKGVEQPIGGVVGVERQTEQTALIKRFGANGAQWDELR